MADTGASNILRQEFEALVRDALLHLYDATYLQTHSLAQLGDRGPGDSASLRGRNLLRALLDAVESLHPSPGASTDSRAWRSYRLLELRYIEGRSAGDVANEMGISKTQYQRDHARALDAVVSVLRERWGLKQSSPASEGVGAAVSRKPLALTEAAQMAGHLNVEYLDLAGTLSGLLTLLEPVVAQRRTSLRFEMAGDLPPIRGDRPALRQVLLGLLNVGVEQGREGTLAITVERRADVLRTTVRSVSGIQTAGSAGREGVVELAVVRRLAEAMHGDVELDANMAHGIWSAVLTLPIARRPLVLVLDNHHDFVHLIARYLAPQGWEVVGTADVHEAEILALERKPRAILLDVMLAGQDGWDLLLALKSRQETREVPVLVCSVLYEPHVAQALGAAGYLPKPVSQDALLEALAPWMAEETEEGASC